MSNNKQFGEIRNLKEYKRATQTKAQRLEQCVIYYDSWQLQCCGNPFSVGDKVDWTCYIPEKPKDAHGILVDYEEDHHDMSTHTITGTVMGHQDKPVFSQRS